MRRIRRGPRAPACHAAARSLRVLLLLIAAAHVPVRAFGELRTVEVESLKIVFDSDWGTRLAPGYLPVRFDITNLGEARVLEIAAEGTRFFRMGRASQPGNLQLRQAVPLARGARVRLTVPVPVSADSENFQFQIREDGRTIERFNYLGVQSGMAPANASALIVADARTAFGKEAAAWPRAAAAGGPRIATPGGRSSAKLDVLLEPDRLPASWLGYTSLRAVVIGPQEWEQLSDAQKDALLTWTACGGDLVFADGDIGALAAGAHAPPAVAPDGAARAYFFGRIHRPATASITAAGLGSALAAAARAQDGDWALPANRGDWGRIVARGFRLPIPGVAGVPARAYLAILLVFSLLIGPANYWILSRRRQQALFVLTTPLISAVFIVVLGAYVIAGEGLAVSARAQTVTLLDQARKQAVTRATASLYAAGMTPGGGLRFARDVAVFSIGPDGRGNLGAQTMDLTEAQRFSSGAIAARSPANLEQIGFGAARARLAFAREGSAMTVVNGLGATVARLLYRIDGIVYGVAGSIPPGGKAAMTPISAAPAGFVPDGLPLTARLQHLVAHQPERSYIAVLDRSPFWEPGVAGVIERGSFHLVIGWPDGQP
jgi:hypothetical protein